MSALPQRQERLWRWVVADGTKRLQCRFDVRRLSSGEWQWVIETVVRETYDEKLRLSGIGAAVARRPLPHHREYA